MCSQAAMSSHAALWGCPDLHRSTRNGCIPARTPSTRSTYRTIKLREPLPEPPRDNPYLRHVARRERALAVARDDHARDARVGGVQ